MLLTVVLTLVFVQTLPAGLLPGNIWPNPTLETDANADGVPDFWHRGGSLTAIDVWTTALSVTLPHFTSHFRFSVIQPRTDLR